MDFFFHPHDKKNYSVQNFLFDNDFYILCTCSKLKIKRKYSLLDDKVVRVKIWSDIACKYNFLRASLGQEIFFIN